MSIRNLRYWEPRADISVFRGFTEQSIVGIQERLISYEIEEHFRKPDKATLVLNNNDGQLMDISSIALGVILKVSYGYPGAMADKRILECRKIKGDMRFGGLGSESGPLTAAAGVVTLELRARDWEMNRHRTLDNPAGDEKRTLRFDNTTIPNIVRALAEKYGYSVGSQSGTKLLVDDLGSEEPTIPTYTIPMRFSDAEWIADQARRRGWAFGIDEEGFHFHPPVLSVGEKGIEDLTWFAGDPDVIDWSLDGDLNVPGMGSIGGTKDEVELRLVENNTMTGELDDDGESSRTTALFAVSFRVGGKTITTDIPLNVPNPSRRRIEAAQRLVHKALNRWTLKMTLVGNPFVHARKTINLSNFAPLVNGPWWVQKVKHSIQAGQVYITEIEAKRKAPKSDNVVVEFRLAENNEIIGTDENGSPIRSQTLVATAGLQGTG